MKIDQEFCVEAIGWISTASFLLSIVIPKRIHLHKLGIFTSVTTGFYAFAHGATAIWVKWIIAFFFHSYMIWKLRNPELAPAEPSKG
jgi:hypothetical protein